jgi:hypothetical protein
MVPSSYWTMSSSALNGTNSRTSNPQRGLAFDF